MFFVHPQIQLKKLGKAISAFFKKPDLEHLTQKLSFYFPNKHFMFTDMGRTAFRVIIEKLNLQNSQMLVPAYICDIFLPIFQRYNIQPIFLDIDLKTFNIKVEEIQQKITPRTKSILICHTYGLPLDIGRIKKNIFSSSLHPSLNLPPSHREGGRQGGLGEGAVYPFIIEDCAHAFGAKLKTNSSPVTVGNSGDVAFFSLYKQFPALRGGLLVCPKDWQIDLPKTNFNFRDFISLLNCFPLFAYLFKRFAGDIAPKMLREEKMVEPASINKVSLNLFSAFLDDFEKSQSQRIETAIFFQQELKRIGFEVQEPENNVFCFLSALVSKNLAEKRDWLVQKLRKYKVFATRIWHTPIILNPEAQKEYQIDLGQFPNTLEAAERIINFPLQNYFTKNDIEMMVKQIKRVMLS